MVTRILLFSVLLPLVLLVALSGCTTSGSFGHGNRFGFDSIRLGGDASYSIGTYHGVLGGN